MGSILTHGLHWVAFSVDLPPRTMIRLVVKSQDAQAAEALRAKWGEGLAAVAKIPDVRREFPQVDKYVSLLMPKVEGDHSLTELNL